MNVMKFPELIGVSGTFGSGKDILAQLLERDHGFYHVSTSDLVREEAMRRYGQIERPVLHKTADECRREHGAGYFVELGIDKPRPLIISGIRSLGEMKAIKQAGGVIVFIDAPIEVRYERMVGRSRDDEVKISVDELKEREEKEMYSGPTDADFNIRAIGQHSDVVLDNSSTIEQFSESALAALSALASGDSQ